MFLQGASRLLSTCDRRSVGEEIAIIDEISGTIPASVLEDFWGALSSREPLDSLFDFVNSRIVLQGYSAGQFCRQVLSRTLQDTQLQDLPRAAICERLAHVEFQLELGADELLQLMDFSALCWRQFNTPVAA